MSLDDRIDGTVAKLEKARNEFFSWRTKRRQANPGGKRRQKASRLQDFWEARKHRLAQRLRKLRKQRAAAKPCETPGDPCWGGCRAVTEEAIDFLERTVTSRKRTDSMGNLGSEHYVGNVNSDAVDWALVNDYASAAALYRHFTGNRGWPGDYSFFYFTFKGMRFRGQLIAGTHGTGPHLHFGVTRIA